jgi:hypothetical protein
MDPEVLDESHPTVTDWRRLERSLLNTVGSSSNAIVGIPDWDPVDPRLMHVRTD